MDDCALARAILVRGPRTGAKHLPCQAEAPISGQNDTWIPPLADRDAQIFRGDRPASHGDGPWAMCAGYEGLLGTFLMACW